MVPTASHVNNFFFTIDFTKTKKEHVSNKAFVHNHHQLQFLFWTKKNTTQLMKITEMRGSRGQLWGVGVGGRGWIVGRWKYFFQLTRVVSKYFSDPNWNAHEYLTFRALALCRANARNVSLTPYPTGDKHTISTFVDQTHIQRTRPRRKTVFFRTSLWNVHGRNSSPSVCSWPNDTSLIIRQPEMSCTSCETSIKLCIQLLNFRKWCYWLGYFSTGLSNWLPKIAQNKRHLL